MRVLGIETSTRRGSVALLEDGRLVQAAEHELPNAHAEQVLRLIERVLADAGWSRSTLDRLGVGIGPGSFVGLRVGIGLAEGLGLGLGRPVVGVPSLQAMARAVPSSEAGLRIALLDARRAELFMAAYSADGVQRSPACAVSRDELGAQLLKFPEDARVLGEVSEHWALCRRRLCGPELDLPHARWVGVLAAELDPATAPPLPLYVRGPGAALPDLPRSPFEQSR